MSTCDEKPKPMTMQQCDCRRRTTRRWVYGIAAVLSAFSGVYVVPAISAGYMAQNTIDSHMEVQAEFEKRMDLRFDTIDDKFDKLFVKFETSWGHHHETRKAFQEMASETQRIRDLLIASGLHTLPAPTE